MISIIILFITHIRYINHMSALLIFGPGNGFPMATNVVIVVLLLVGVVIRIAIY